MRREHIAIVGIGCRFPGGANDPDSFWKLLVERRDAVREVPADRWNVERFYDPEPGIVGKTFSRHGGFIDDIDQFDPQFFGISPREAPYVDPQHRLLLVTAWEALEDSGAILDFAHGSDIGVFVGVSHNDYQGIQGSPWDRSGIGPHSPTGHAHSIAANRISYCLNLRGPSIALDTACSSALTAVHVACQHIWAGGCPAALAGGVTVMITPEGFIGFSQAGMISPEGRSKAFDASADGFARGEGAGMVLLKPLSQARADNDPIYAVILGSAVNQDGHTNGLSLPSAEAQAALVRAACADAGVEPHDITFVEAHGTGTAVGDPIEAHALAEALCAGRAEDAPLVIGSVKSNLGHLETAAGIAGLVKAALVLKYGQIPPNLHFATPNPHIDFPALKLRVPTQLENYPASGRVRVVGVNSFGFGGSNAHIVMREAPRRKGNGRAAALAADHMLRAWPLVVSARSETALRAAAERLAAWIADHNRTNGATNVLPALAYTLGARRNHHPHRLALAATAPGEAVQELRNFAVEGAASKARSAFVPRRDKAVAVGFVMSGQGPQWWGMGRELMATEPVFRQAMEACSAAIDPWARFSLMEELARDEATSNLDRTEMGQPAIFAMQVGLAALWRSWGVVPSAVTGHSVGEVAAAHVAGALTLEQAGRVIALRGRAMDDCADGGTMLAVGLGKDEARALVARHDPLVTLAAFNAPRAITLAGSRQSLEAIAAELEANGAFARFVKVNHGFHSPAMQPAADALGAELADPRPSRAAIPLVSTVTGMRCAGTDLTAAHWANSIRQPVQFVDAVGAMAEAGVEVWLELGAHPALVHSIQECLAARGDKAPVIASARREREQASVVEAATELHLAGVGIGFAAMTPSRELLPLPTYPWDNARWWKECADARGARLGPGGHGLLDIRLPVAKPTWIGRLDSRHMAFLKDHRVGDHLIFPAAGFVDMAIEAGVDLFDGRPLAIEDFEIRKPLLLPDDPADVLLELSFEPADRTFTISSRLGQAAAWSVHVVGSMRAERTESAFAATTWTASDETAPMSRDAFYEYMSRRGLRYGEEFQPVHEIRTGAGKSAGRLRLSDGVRPRHRQFPLHPVLFDGALQVFSGGAAALEDMTAGLRLPVRFSRILYLRSPGASARVVAAVRESNDAFVEGSIGIYDDDGEPCVQVDGFRAVSVEESSKRAGWRDVVYHVAWQRTPSPLPRRTIAPVPLGRLRDVTRDAFHQVVALRGGRERLEAQVPACDDLAAMLIAQGLVEMGVGESFSAESLGVCEGMRSAFGRLTAALVDRALLATDGDRFRATPAFVPAANAAGEALRGFLREHPGSLPELMLCAANCSELGAILRGEKDAVQVLFAGAGRDFLDQFYSDGLITSPWLVALARMVEEIARQLPEGRGLRILEVGAGTGGLAAQVLPVLERGLHRYVFSDISAAFFPGANQKLAAFPEVECKLYDLEQPCAEQGFDPASFDLVLATNVIHAVRDVRVAIAHIRELLAPDGTLAFLEVATARLWLDTVFGLTSGWWHFVDRDLRRDQPLLDRRQWERVLREGGFADVASLAGLSPGGEEAQIGLFARRDAAAAVEPPPPPTVPDHRSWLVLTDQAGFGSSLADRLRAGGARCRIVLKGDDFAADGDAFVLREDEPEDWRRLAAACAADAPLERIVFLWSLDDTIAGDLPPAAEALLHLVQAIEVASPTAALRIDVVTRGAQPAGRDDVPVDVDRASVIGLMRVVMNERLDIRCRAIDLPALPSTADAALVWGELHSDDNEREVAFRDEARYVQRIDRGLPSRQTMLDATVPLRLDSRERGTIDALRYVPLALPACGGDEVVVEVKAAGTNFRDVLKALGLYPSETPDARLFGDEIAGEVVAVGGRVANLSPGDRVFGITVSGLATRAIARAEDLRPIPRDLSFEDAATIPVVFMTALHALRNVAHVQRGERVLVHAGAGGVGMAAIQIARHLGADVIATAGSPAKRDLLRLLGVAHVIDSRRADFVEAVMDITHRRGVDVVLNSLAAEAIPMGLACLAPFGRFIEIGKRDIYENARVPLRPLRNNASFHVVAMDAIFNDPATTAASRLMGEIVGLIEKGALSPLPYRAFPACRVDAAFRLMAQGKHVGKVVLSFAGPMIVRRAEPPARRFVVNAEATYLVTGAFGGFGRVVASWLADRGARHLVLAGRSGPATAEAQAFLETMESRGVTVEVVRADIGSPADVTRLAERIRSSGRPLKGVFHLAMVLDDAPLARLTSERMHAVFDPKARGAWLLHQATLGQDLDCFVMFSSVSSVFGNPAQGNYAAANAVLDALAHHRRALGLPALTVNWGALGGTGYVARNERVAEFMARQGRTALSPTEVLTLLERFLDASVPQALALRADWSRARQTLRGMQGMPILERILADSDESGDGGGAAKNWRPRIDAAAPADRDAVITEAVRDIVGSVLRMKPANLRLDQPLTDLGMDSLMAVETENLIESGIGISLPPSSLMQARTIGHIVALLVEHFGGNSGSSRKPARPEAATTATADELDIDALSDEDIDALLDGDTRPAAQERRPSIQ